MSEEEIEAIEREWRTVQGTIERQRAQVSYCRATLADQHARHMKAQESDDGDEWEQGTRKTGEQMRIAHMVLIATESAVHGLDVPRLLAEVRRLRQDVADRARHGAPMTPDQRADILDARPADAPFGPLTYLAATLSLRYSYRCGRCQRQSNSALRLCPKTCGLEGCEGDAWYYEDRALYPERELQGENLTRMRRSIEEDRGR